MLVSGTLFPWLAPLPGIVASAATMLEKFDTNADVDMRTLCSQDQLEPTISPCQEQVRLHVHMSKDSHRVRRESDEMKHAEEGDGPTTTPEFFFLTKTRRTCALIEQRKKRKQGKTTKTLIGLVSIVTLALILSSCFGTATVDQWR